LEWILRRGLEREAAIDLNTLVRGDEFPLLNLGAYGVAAPPPVWSDYVPHEPSALAGFFGAKSRHEQRLAAARDDFERAKADYDRAEATRQEWVHEQSSRYEAALRAHDNEVARHNSRIAQIASGLRNPGWDGDPGPGQRCAAGFRTCHLTPQLHRGRRVAAMRDIVRRATERGEFRPAPSRRGKWKAAVMWATSNFLSGRSLTWNGQVSSSTIMRSSSAASLGRPISWRPPRVLPAHACCAPRPCRRSPSGDPAPCASR
jgi:hypothetical protein